MSKDKGDCQSTAQAAAIAYFRASRALEIGQHDLDRLQDRITDHKNRIDDLRVQLEKLVNAAEKRLCFAVQDSGVDHVIIIEWTPQTGAVISLEKLL